MKPQTKRIASAAVPLLLTALAAAALFFLRDRSDSPNTSSMFVMDSIAEIRLYGADTKTSEELLSRLDTEFDAYSPDSPVYSFNLNGSTHTGADLYRLTNEVRTLSDYGGSSVRITCGALTQLWNVTAENPSVPKQSDIDSALLTIDDSALTFVPDGSGYSLSTDILSQKLDLGSVAKGYTCDRLCELFDSMGSSRPTCGLVSMGSSSLLYGEKPDGTDFRIEIRSPDGYSQPLGFLTTPACFISTSGGYERFFEADGKRYIHILDLENGYPSESDLKSVTIVTDSGVKSDYLSTLVFLDGTVGLERHLNSPDFMLAAVSEDGSVFVSEGLDFELTDTEHYHLAEGE